MIRLSYKSRLCEDYNNYESIKNIEIVSELNNTKYSIFGELFWNVNTGNIIQILEGDIIRINELYEKLKKDKRHKNIILMECSEIVDRTYTKWECNIVKKNDNITFNDFEPLEYIGKGGFSNVILMKNNLTKKKYAVKIISKTNLNKNKLKMIVCEKNILKKLNNQFIVKLDYCFQDPLSFFLVLEYVNGGDLYNLIHNNKNLLGNIDVVKYYFNQLIIAIDYIHSNNVIHGDLKLENILLTKSGLIKVADFGTSVLFYDNTMSHSLSGHTPIYISPEQFKHKIKNASNDIWAIALILYELYYLYLPWNNYDSIKELFNLINSTEIILNSSDELLNELFNKMTVKEPHTDRYTSKQILNDVYFKNVDWDSITNLPKIISDNIMVTHSSPERTNYFRGLTTINDYIEI